MRGGWKQPATWAIWWRERVSLVDKVTIAVCALAAVLVAGWIAADSLSSASAEPSSAASQSGPLVETVTKVVTVRNRGRVVTDKVPVVKRVYVHDQKAASGKTHTVVQTRTAFQTSTVVQRATAYVTHTVTAPPQTITQVVTETVPKVQWKVVTVVQTVTITVPSSP